MTDFQKFVSALDGAKEEYYLLRFILERKADEYFHVMHSCIFSKRMLCIKDDFEAKLYDIATDLENDGSLADATRAMKDAIEELRSHTPRIFVEGEDKPYPLELAILKEMDTRDTKFYDLLGVGEFWNEVPMPDVLERIWNAGIHRVASECPLWGIIFEPVDDCAAITYYDLSDLEIVFDTFEHAEVFATVNGVDPSDYMLYSAGCWHSL